MGYFLARKILRSGRAGGNWTPKSLIIMLIWAILPIGNIGLLGTTIIVHLDCYSDWWDMDLKKKKDGRTES